MKEFFRELRARWGEKINAFWAKMLQAAVWASGLQAVFLGILENPTIASYAAPWLLAFLKIGLSVSVTAALVAKITVADSKSLERKLHEKDLHIKKSVSSKGGALPLLLLFLALPACTTFQKCQEKYGTTVKDTIRLYRTHIVPKDSAVVQFRHDTVKTFQTIIEKQGRATVIVEKLQDVYRVQAHCDTVVMRDTITVPVEKVVFRCPEPEWYELWQNWALIISFLLIVFLLWFFVGRRR